MQASSILCTLVSFENMGFRPEGCDFIILSYKHLPGSTKKRNFSYTAALQYHIHVISIFVTFVFLILYYQGSNVETCNKVIYFVISYVKEKYYV